MQFSQTGKERNMRRKKMDIQALYKIRYLREIALSPDGKKIAFTVEWMDKKKNRYHSNLFVVGEDGKTHHYVRGKKDIKQPKWSPNGKLISFIRTDIEKKKQDIWAIPADGGEAYAITNAKGFFGTYVWTPDSRYIVCEFTIKKDDKERVPDEKKPPLYYHVTDVWYKLDGRGMLPAEKPHIWRITAKSGTMKQLTFGTNGDHNPAVSADGKQIVFVSNRQKDWLRKYLYIDIFTIDINGKKEGKIQTPAGPKDAPVFSPDGLYIAYVGRQDPESWAGWLNDYIWLVPVRGGKAVNVTKSFDRSIPGYIIDDLGHYARTIPIFSADGRFLYQTVADKGSARLYGIDIKKKTVVTVQAEDEVIYAYDYDGRETFALAIATPTDPGDVYMLKDKKLKRLTTINKDYFRTHRVLKPEEFWFKGDQGDQIQGWLLKPPNFNKKKKYPLIVQIHGGPFAGYGNSLFHEFQVLAQNGYVVFYCNPHGSVGYGERFAKALHNKWGIPDTKDILKAVRSLTRKYIDKKRMAVMGGSYGGYMTNWIIGHTNMFTCAVTMRSVVNMLSFFSSDFGFGFPHEFKGYWWEKRNFQFYWNMSPLKYIKKMKTPLLIIHSEQDHRCPISQAEELFVALKLLKREVEMVRFPMEPHGLSRHGSPRRREKRLEFISRFVDKHLKK
jgi:acylaminoacyl-peptidase